MKPEQLFKQNRKTDEVDSVELNLGPSYLSLMKRYMLEDYVYPNEIVDNIKHNIDFLYDYKSYHFGYFIEGDRFFSFSGLYALNQLLFNSNHLKDDFKIAIIGYSYKPEMSLFIDIDQSSPKFEAIFIQNISTLEDIQDRIYIANNLEELISKLRLYLVGKYDKFMIV